MKDLKASVQILDHGYLTAEAAEMTDEELIAFCDAMIADAADPNITIPERFASWSDGDLQSALVHMACAARESVALRQQIATLREALKPMSVKIEGDVP